MTKKMLFVFYASISIVTANTDSESRSVIVFKTGASLLSAAHLGLHTLSQLSLINRVNPALSSVQLIAGTYGVYNEIVHAHCYWKRVDRRNIAHKQHKIGSLLQASASVLNAGTLLHMAVVCSFFDPHRLSSLDANKQTAYSMVFPLLGMICFFGVYNELSDVCRFLKKK